MPAGKKGPADVFVYVDGYDITPSKLQELRRKIEAIQIKSDGLGDEWEEHTPLGVKRGEYAPQGGFWDTAAGQSHAALSTEPAAATPQQVPRVVCIGFAGVAIGDEFDGFEGLFQVDYDVIAARGDLQRANAEYQVTGSHGEGVVLQPKAAKTADWDTESTPHDNSASSANGGVGYLHIFAASGFTNFVLKFRDSSDDITYGDLLTMTDSVTAPSSERKTVSGTVDRYLAIDGNVTGTGSITVFAGFSRNA